MLTGGGLTTLLTGSFGFRQLFNKTFASGLVKLLAGFFQFRKLLSPKRLFSFLRRLVGWKERWPVKDFSNHDFIRIHPTLPIEEETMLDYRAKSFYPVRIGEVFSSRYQVVGKLGFGTTSTSWLARDLEGCRYVTLEVYVQTSILRDNEVPELVAYKRLEKGPKDHPGRHAIHSLLDSFVIKGPDGEHHCLVHQPLGNSIRNWRGDNRLAPKYLASVLQQLLLAIDYMKECEVIHGDINENNIRFTLTDTALLERFEKQELEYPTDRKEVDGRIIYESRSIGRPKESELGLPVLCDFGVAVWGGKPQHHCIKLSNYQSPEEMLGAPWSYEVDIWSVGCLIWDLFETRSLFFGTQLRTAQYAPALHLAEMICLLGFPNPEFLARCHFGSLFFFPDGRQRQIGDVPLLPLAYFETTLKDLEGNTDRDLFLRFVNRMIQWDPRDRYTAKQLLEDEWLTDHLPSD